MAPSSWHIKLSITHSKLSLLTLFVHLLLWGLNNTVTSLVVQWLRLHAPKAGGLGSTPDQWTRSHMLQLRISMLQIKILHAATKTQHSQINKYGGTHAHSWLIYVDVWEKSPQYCKAIILQLR